MPAQEIVHPKSSKSLISNILPYGVLFIFVVFSFLAYWYFDMHKRMDAEHWMEQEMNRQVSQIGERLDRDTAIIRGLQGLFNASATLERNEFYDYIATLNLSENYPGIYSIAYAERVKDQDVPAFIEAFKKDTSVQPEGYASVSLHPTTTDKEHYVLKYIFPEEKYKNGLGFDMTSEPERRDAILHTISTKKPTITKKIKLVTDNTDAVLLFLPVEKNNEVVGVVMVTLQLDTFFTSLVQNSSVPGNFGFTVSEIATQSSVEDVFYSIGNIERVKKPVIMKKQHITYGEKTWELTFFADHEYGLTKLVKLVPLGVAELVAAIGALLFFIFLQLSRVKDEAVKLAETMVLDLKESESRFRAITDSAKDAIVMMDSEARVVLWNKAAEGMFGWTQEEMMGKLFHMMITTKPEHQHTEALLAFGQTGQSAVLGKTLELPVKRKDGTIFTIGLTVARTKLHNEWHAVGIMRDVTERINQAKILADHAKELARMNKLMVDRELKMIELKKQTTKTP